MLKEDNNQIPPWITDLKAFFDSIDTYSKISKKVDEQSGKTHHYTIDVDIDDEESAAYGTESLVEIMYVNGIYTVNSVVWFDQDSFADVNKLFSSKNLNDIKNFIQNKIDNKETDSFTTYNFKSNNGELSRIKKDKESTDTLNSPKIKEFINKFLKYDERDWKIIFGNKPAVLIKNKNIRDAILSIPSEDIKQIVDIKQDVKQGY